MGREILEQRGFALVQPYSISRGVIFFQVIRARIESFPPPRGLSPINLAVHFHKETQGKRS